MRPIRWSIATGIGVSLFVLLGAACDDETTEPPPPPTQIETCSPTCNPDSCMVCDELDDEFVCRTACGTDATCESGTCVPIPIATCEPACGSCQMCDTTAATPVCIDVCADGTTCNAGVCEVVPIATCEPACGDCQRCDTSGSPICVDLCGDGTTCNAGVCAPEVPVRTGFHVNFLDLAGPFASGPEVTEKCIGCHQREANDFMLTAHWLWEGPTPNLLGHDNDRTIGKKNLINNFCIGIDANEPRCTQCHAGYGWGLPASNNDPTFDFADASKIDCLICHADPASGYKKAKKTAGNVPLNTEGLPAFDLAIAATSVGAPEVGNCGACHFFAGGGDNVKKGDLASSLLAATVDMDVHMGKGMSCANCHAGTSHHIVGQGVHIPVSEGRVTCADCHGDAPHTEPLLDNHSIDIACETCHIPAFSRVLPTKMHWDWSTAGDRTRTPTMQTFGDIERPAYDWMKGTFVWETNVRPAYAWYDGRASHLTTTDAFTQAGTESDPVVIAAPLANFANMDAKIYPFKRMTGRQAADATGNFLIVPDLFGPGSFWGVLSQPANEGTDHSATADPEIWNTMLTTGARAAGQITPAEAYGVDRTWRFVDTVMWLGIEHEVAPKEDALFCTDCHTNPAFDFEALGYLCDPVNEPERCGARHPQ